MKLVGIMPVRNEDWCLGFTLRVALKWCDEVIVLLHSCSDRSLQICANVQSEVFDRLGYLIIDGDGWDEMEHRQKMLECARSNDATHVAIIDADEFLTANLLGRTRGDIEYYTLHEGLLELPGYNLRERDGSDPWQYHANGVWGNRWFSTAFRDRPEAHWGGDRFHHRAPMGVNWMRNHPVQQGCGGTLHLWGASERRLRAKHALYRITERLRWPDKPAADIERLYSLATTPREPWTFKTVPPEWLSGYEDLMPHLKLDAEPWQLAEVKRLVQEYGSERFIGLDLLGVPEW